ncbi:MAG TPA: hypothetical protein VFD58_11880 [Blastocatellia bacterium]|nr:hypothetical protein [Blastocatellia bacterium]
MIDNTFAPAANEAFSPARPRALYTILFGGLTVGVLDGLAATIIASLRGTSPGRVFQYIASGLLGPDSFNHGSWTVLLGVLLHFLIASIVATIYYFASLRLPILIRQAVVWGALYGIAVQLVMSRIVIPLSAAQALPFSLTGFLRSIVVHIFCVGLPVALFARWSARAS